MKKTKAVALYSGGLDSTLAILVMQKQGVEVTATHSQRENGSLHSCGQVISSGVEVRQRSDHPFFGDADFQGSRPDTNLPAESRAG